MNEEILENRRKYYYKLDEQGNIKQCLHLQNPSDEIKSEYLETEREIIVAPNGKLVFADEIAEIDFSIPLEEIKSNKIAQLKAERDAKELEPITFNGYTFDFDKDAIMRMELAERSLRGTTQGITWTDADNNRVNNVNADDLNAILVQGTIRSNELHIRYNDLKALVEKATSQAEVESVVW